MNEITKYLAKIGAKGGAVKSKAKAKAAKANGKKGGRPTLCKWYLNCKNVATTTAPHPILGDVPCCDRCHDLATKGMTTRKPTRLTFASINKAIASTGLTLVGTKGDGYFYFLNKDEDQVGDSVYVNALNHLTLDQWIAEAKSAVEDGRLNGMNV